MTDLGLEQRLREVSLTVDQQRIATVLTGDLNRVAFLSGSKLASECGVSTSAITRFAQKLGYGGFPELKQVLEQRYRETTTPYEVFERFVAEGSESSVIERSFAQDLRNIHILQQQLDVAALERAASLLGEAAVVHLAAIGTSELLVETMHAYLEPLGVKTNRLRSFGITKVAEVTEIAPDHVVIGFSFQRILREVRDLLVYLREKGCRTIAITDSPVNALAVVADVVLVAPVGGVTFALSQVGPLTLVNALANAFAAHDIERSRHLLKELKADWERCPIFCEPGQGTR